MPKKVLLITGSSGRIGKICVDRFADEYEVVGFDLVEYPHAKKMTYIFMDLSSDESVSDALQEVRDRFGTEIASVIHLAAYYSFNNQRPELYDAITVQGTRRLLEGLHQTFTRVEQFLFSSTVLVHKPCNVGETIVENSPLEPKWEYPKSKVKTEKVIETLHGNIPAVIMRIAGCYDDLCHSIPISHNIQRIYEKEWVTRFYPGDITHGNPFLHMEDLGDAIALAVKKRKELPPFFVVNISEDKTPSYEELQNQICRILGMKEFKIYRVPKWFAKGGAWMQNHLPFFHDDFIQPWMIDLADDHYQFDITRARTILGWEPKHYLISRLPVMMGLLKTDPIEWYRENELTDQTK